MKRFRLMLLLICTCCISYYHAFSQKNLDEIFDDPETNFSLFLGTDIVRTAFGTPNVATSASLMKERIFLKVDMGMPVFGYRISFGHPPIFENQVKGGLQCSMTMLYKFQNMPDFGYASFYGGVEFEYWNYFSENTDVAKKLGFVDGKALFDHQYGYSLDPEYRFYFQRKTQRIGIVYGMIMELKKKRQLDLLIHFGFDHCSVKFNDESYGVNWLNNEPSGWIRRGWIVHGGGYLRLSLTYKFKLV